MRVIIVGLGVQGQKRKEVAGRDVVAVVDPDKDGATHKTLVEVPPDSYDAALVCTPDDIKIDLLSSLLAAGKHVLVEKPLIGRSPEDLPRLSRLCDQFGVTCYTAYNHRFEPHIDRMAGLIRSGELGKIYSIRLFYGNGTARPVRDSLWRDSGSGVLRDLGSHLLDLVRFLFGEVDPDFEVVSANRFENRAYDHVVLAARGTPFLQLEMSLVMWRNHFACDIIAEKGSAHISSLCKWGESTFTHRTRVLPSGLPGEEVWTASGPDPTWHHEYAHFKQLCRTGGNRIAADIWIDRKLAKAAGDAAVREVG